MTVGISDKLSEVTLRTTGLTKYLVDFAIGDVLPAKADHAKAGVGPDGVGLLEDERNAMDDEQTDERRIFAAHPGKKHRRHERFAGTRRQDENDVVAERLDEGRELVIAGHLRLQDVVPTKLFQSRVFNIER